MLRVPAMSAAALRARRAYTSLCRRVQVFGVKALALGPQVQGPGLLECRVWVRVQVQGF